MVLEMQVIVCVCERGREGEDGWMDGWVQLVDGSRVVWLIRVCLKPSMCFSQHLCSSSVLHS